MLPGPQMNIYSERGKKNGKWRVLDLTSRRRLKSLNNLGQKAWAGSLSRT